MPGPCSNLCMKVCPKMIDVEFQTTYHIAVTKVWSVCEFEACRLHLGQCWGRNMQYLWLDKRCGQKDSEVSQLFEENIPDRIYKQRKSATVLVLAFYTIFRTGEWNNLATASRLFIDAGSTFCPLLDWLFPPSIRTTNACWVDTWSFNVLIIKPTRCTISQIYFW
jgi:hypothetical protein